MIVKELIQILKSKDQNAEVTVKLPAFYVGGSLDTTRLLIEEGYVVKDKSNNKTGYFVSKRKMEKRIIPDGKMFLDLTSPNIKNSVHIQYSYYD